VSVRLRPFIEEEQIVKDRSICIDTLDPDRNVIISNG